MNKIPDSASFRRPIPVPTAQAATHSTGRITWSQALELPARTPSAVDRAVFRFRKALPDFTWNAAALEGNTFTLPEVRTLLDGVTVGGKRLAEAEQILALRDAINLLTDLVSSGDFRLDKHTSDLIHAQVARHEAIEFGKFRGEGNVAGGGHVQLTDGGRIEGIPAAELPRDYANLMTALASISDPVVRAMVYFCSATRSQFYFDGNKRTARLMMAGELLAHGYDAINVPYARALEFHMALDELFTTDDATEMMLFLGSC
ncbi:Fic family protein [Corynebacterium epidermidicanis]|uniref:Fic/DOC family protein n=1 Tax=Corynebacterium epidermidicanis TaxID=1050174 RepID=A0A0G3GY30_9CORY|nr:Fic family protein [Corynebacterium epidermidicanis]AKK03732.1 Fic/DOC family protein [Corynebacterium epidermidicanis]